MRSLTSPFTSHELTTLHTSLGAFADAGGMDLHRAHGLLTAVSSAPEVIPPGAWTSLIVGEHRFEDGADAQHAFTLLMRWHSQINDALSRPGFTPPDYPEPAAVREWCVGYLAGVRLDARWSSNEAADKALMAMRVLAGEAEPGIFEGPNGEVYDDPVALEQAYVDAIPSIAVGFSDMWREFRRRLAQHERGARNLRVEKIGRNAPCPCGSGKKYKKCCG